MNWGKRSQALDHIAGVLHCLFFDQSRHMYIFQ